MNKSYLDKFFNRFKIFNPKIKPKFELETVRLFECYFNTVVEVLIREDGPLRMGLVCDGQKHDINLFMDSSPIYSQIFCNLNDFPPLGKSSSYFQSVNVLLGSRLVPLHMKVQLVLFEVKGFRDVLFEYFKTDEYGYQNLLQRAELINEYFDSEGKLSVFSIEAVTEVYSLLLEQLIKSLTMKGQLLQCLNYLHESLSCSASALRKNILIKNFIGFATSYNLLSRKELEDKLDEYCECLSCEEVEYLNSEITADGSAFDFHALYYSTGELSIKNTCGRKIKTLIAFSMPIECIYDKPVKISGDNGEPEVNIFPIETFWMDPMFEFFMSYKIGGIGWSYFSDLSVDSEGKFSHIVVSVEGLYCPDVELLETSSRLIDFSEKELVEGRRYYPHKDFAVKTLLDSYDVLETAIRVKSKSEISANLFSNLIVQYVDDESKAIIQTKLIALTSYESFSKVRSKFLEKLSTRNLNDAYIGVRQLLTNTSIESERNLKDFVLRTLDLIVKKNIEDEGGYRYLWSSNEGCDNVPHSEPYMQPYILGHLKIIYEYMGIQISRECISANGEIDFLVTYSNTKNELLRVCVEMKLAHNAKLHDGITKQLPRYMKAERARYGVFLVLWFKGRNANFIFNEPSGYNSLVELGDSLQSINGDKNISLITINCSKPTYPSKL